MALEILKRIICLVVCMLVVSALPASSGTAVMNGHIDFLDYTGSNLLLPVGVQFIQNGSAVRTERVFLDPANSFTITGLDAGTYDIAFSASGCLRKTIPGVQFTSGVTSPVSASLENGDLSGDNSIGLIDLSIVSANHGKSGQ